MRLIDADAFKRQIATVSMQENPAFPVIVKANNLCKFIDMQPTVIGWIEVEERSPEDRQTVLVSNGQYVYLVEYDADWDAPYGDMDDIVAWMPLPEPYRPEPGKEYR